MFSQYRHWSWSIIIELVNFIDAEIATHNKTDLAPDKLFHDQET